MLQAIALPSMLILNTRKLIIIIIASLSLGACNFSPTKSTSKQSIPEKKPVYVVHPSGKLSKSINSESLARIEKKKRALDFKLQETEETIQATNLWEVIASELEFERPINHPAVQEKIRWYKKNQEYLDRVADRATPYLHYIIHELKQNDLPIDLALLPIVESAYQPFAYSPSRASGLWQFMPATGKQFGLKQNWWYDGRRDIVASTNAAIKYLKQLNQQFNGDWPLTLAAYNAGPGNIQKAIRNNSKKGKPTDYWNLKLHRETRHYVPSLIALAEILVHEQKHNVQFKPISNQKYFQIVDIKNQIDLAIVSDMTKMDMDSIYQLNPGFNRWATAPNGPHRLLIPVNIADSFTQKLASLPESERLTWRKHKIKSGETLSQIAQIYRTNVHALKTTNRLKNSRIRAGKFLLIPTSKRSPESYTLSQDSRRYKGLKRSNDGNDYIYRIKRGDNLWDISRHYGVSVAQLCRWNGINRRSTLRLGQKLLIKIKPDQSSPNNIKIASKKSSNGLYKVDYEVQDGDSLWLISKQFGVSVKELKRWNNLANGRYLQPGQNINVYTDKKPTGA